MYRRRVTVALVLLTALCIYLLELLQQNTALAIAEQYEDCKK